MGAIIIPATAPTTDERPQPSASILSTRMPTRRLDSALSATARSARPSDVKRKNA